jgi:hypothetical protein
MYKNVYNKTTAHKADFDSMLFKIIFPLSLHNKNTEVTSTLKINVSILSGI